MKENNLPQIKENEVKTNKYFPMAKSFTIYENEHDEFSIYDKDTRSDFDEYDQLFDIEFSFY